MSRGVADATEIRGRLLRFQRRVKISVFPEQADVTSEDKRRLSISGRSARNWDEDV